jgi:transposase-like protein
MKKLTNDQRRHLRALLESVSDINDLQGPDGLLASISGEGINMLLEAERNEHLGYPPNAVEGYNTGNSRNGYSKKTVKTSHGELDLAIPRDRNGTFLPVVVPPHSRVLGELERKVLALYARGMSTRDIHDQLGEIYGSAISPTTISSITDQIIPKMQEWQNRPLESLYVFTFLDAIYLKVRREGRVQNTAVYTCLGVTLQGRKQLLGLWVGEQEGARYWQTILTDLSNRGVEDILFVCVDGLKGFPEAIASLFPQAEVQQCIIHAIRRAMQYVSYTDRKLFAADLRLVYTAQTESDALLHLDALEAAWGKKYPHAIATWRSNWTHLCTFFAYPQCIRKIMYTTNAVESVHRQMRKAVKTKGAFPSEDAAMKALFLNLQIVEKKWKATSPRWPDVLNYLMVSHENRIKPFCI